MTFPQQGPSRQLMAVWFVTVAVCLTALSLAGIVEAKAIRVLGFDLAQGLTGTGLLSASAVCLTTVRIFKARRREKKRITVRELRRRAGYHRSSRTKRTRKRVP